MGDQLYAVVFKKRTQTATKTGKSREKWVRGYRAPRPEDDNLNDIQRILGAKLPEWEALILCLRKGVPADINDDRPIRWDASLARSFLTPSNFWAWNCGLKSSGNSSKSVRPEAS
jgi:hypothetical protein